MLERVFPKDPYAQILPPTKVRTSNAMKTIALVGLGSQGWRLLQTAENLGYEVVVVCDLDRKKLKAIKKRRPHLIVTANIHDLAKAAPDMVVVATLADSHAALVEKLIEMGLCRILIEKPAANSMADCAKLAGLAAMSDTALAVYHTALFHPDIEMIRRQLADPVLQQLKEIHIQFKPSGFANIGSHMLALVCFITGSSINRIKRAEFVDEGGLKRGAGYQDPNGTFVGEMDNGAHLIVDNRDLPFNLGSKMMLQFENATIRWHLNSHLFIDYMSPGLENEVILFTEPVNSLAGRHICFDQALTNLIEKNDRDRFNVSLHAVESIIAAHLSATGREEIYLPLDNATTSPYQFS